MVPHVLAVEELLPVAARFVPARLSPKERLPHVLSVERQPELLLQRAVLLRSIGCVVRSTGPERVLDLVIAQFYRVAIFGHTLSNTETAEVAVQARAANPATKLVLVASTEPRPRMIESLFDVVVADARGPAALARTVRLLLAGVPPSRS